LGIARAPHSTEDAVFAIIAAVLFALALIFQLAGTSLGVITATSLMLAGLLCVALHLAGAASWGGRGWYRRRRR
jgi:hypothetical protein